VSTSFRLISGPGALHGAPGFLFVIVALHSAPGFLFVIVALHGAPVFSLSSSRFTARRVSL
jgi:hypothetical protein